MQKIYLKNNIQNAKWIVIDENKIIVDSDVQSYWLGFQVVGEHIEAGYPVWVTKKTTNFSYKETINIKTIEQVK